jgi:hypothetical protein
MIIHSKNVHSNGLFKLSFTVRANIFKFLNTHGTQRVATFYYCSIDLSFIANIAFRTSTINSGLV